MRVRIFVAAVALLSANLAARADSFSFTLSGSGDGFSGSGTLTAASTGSDGGYLISGIEGGYTLINAGAFAFNNTVPNVSTVANTVNDDLLFPSSSSGAVDSSGFAFMTSNSQGNFTVDIFSSAGTDYAYIDDEDGYVGTIPVTFTVAAATPEPSSFILLGTGLLGVAGLARRRSLA